MRIRCSAVYDNSEDNIVIRNSNRVVGWGDQSFDEMMIGFFTVVDADKVPSDADTGD